VTADILDERLFELAAACVREAHELVRKHREAGAWIPKVVGFPALGKFDSGWPSVSNSMLSSDVPDYSRLFGLAQSTLTPLTYDDVRHLRELLEYAKTHERLADYYALELQRDDDRLFRIQIVDFALEVLNRLLNLYGDDFSDEQLRSTYREYERGVLAEQLPIAIVVPIALTPFELESRISLNDRMSVERMSDDWQLARATRGAQYGEGAGASPVVVGAATHALVLDFWWLPNRKSLLGGGLETHRLAFYPLEEIERFFQALRIVTGLETGFAQISIRPNAWAHRWEGKLPAVVSGALGRRYPSWFDDWGWLREPPAPISNAQVEDVGRAYAALEHAGRQVGVAARRLSAATLRETEEDAIIDLCIGLEAALGDESHAEITHKLALRTAAVVARSVGADPQLTFRQVKDIYRFRSAVVHGKSTQKVRTVSGGDGQLLATVVAAQLLRQVLAALLEHPDWRDPSRVDDLVVSALTGLDEDESAEATAAS
jgi:hypothetical protein